MPSGHGTLRQHEQGSSELAHISKTTSGLSFSRRASNTRAYICIFVGGCGLVVALIMGLKLRNAIGPEILVGLVGGLTLLTGVFARRPGHNVADSEGHLDRPRVCSRCGRVWPTWNPKMLKGSWSRSGYTRRNRRDKWTPLSLASFAFCWVWFSLLECSSCGAIPTMFFQLYWPSSWLKGSVFFWSVRHLRHDHQSGMSA